MNNNELDRMDKKMKYDEVMKEMIMDYLKIDKYERIINNLHKMDISTKDNQFKDDFNSYYMVRRDPTWQEKYYTYFQNIKDKDKDSLSFSKILQDISFDDKVESSFASKMLATIDQDKPIIDKNILNYFKLKIDGSTKEERIDKAIKVYDTIEKEYKKLLRNDEINSTIDKLKKLIDKNDISETKILDYILWCKGKEKNSKN